MFCEGYDVDLISPCKRATVRHEAMNVTLKIPDELCREARHRAVDESKSLSAWMVEQMKRALSEPPPTRKKSLIEMIGQDDIPEEHIGKELPLEDRKTIPVREFSFGD
jgi:hypothetical protein